jgi:nucleoside-diphosphate-sugar epimerase
MKVLITGASGFIGGFLAKHCEKADSKVLGIDFCEPQDGWVSRAFELCFVMSGTPRVYRS